MSNFQPSDWIAIAAIGAGLITTLGATWLTNHFARARETESRAHDLALDVLAAKREPYLQIADFAVRLRAAGNIAAAASPEELTRLAERIGDDRWWLIQAYVAAHGSTTIREQFDQLLTLRVRLSNAMANWQEILRLPPGGRSPDEIQFLDEVRARREELLARCERLLDQINTELAQQS